MTTEHDERTIATGADEHPISFARLRNGQSLAIDDVPILELESFREAVIRAPDQRRRVAALFGARAEDGRLMLVVVTSDDSQGMLYVARAVLERDTFASMTPECPQVHLFERELAEQWSVTPVGHPWLKPVRFSASNSGRAEPKERHIGLLDYYRVAGDGVHEVAVGPVHAGVIEPGHFRFQCHGEEVFHLEISLGYQHRGVERAVMGGPDKRTIHYMETLAGDTSIGHALAYCQLSEALSGTRPSGRAHAVRAIALELERLANHTGGLGALANDVGYLPTAAYLGRLRGDFLNLTALVCGSRFGRSWIRPGGVAFDIDAAAAKSIAAKLALAHRDVERAVKLLWDTASVQARFDGTGVLDGASAESLGIVGVAARASGLERDVRHDHPTGIYRLAQIPMSVAHRGDVAARARVRWLEIQRATTFVADQLAALPAGTPRAASPELMPRRLCVSLVEGWRGEICHVALTDGGGRFSAYKIIDPSFHNWFGLALAFRNQQISDFPLCNKSFDLSYCGFDL